MMQVAQESQVVSPLSTRPAPAADASETRPDNGKMPASILIVDDNDFNRKILAAMLRKGDYTLLSAENGERALQLAREEQPDLILLDIMMPEMDGYHVCAELLRDERTARTPVIFLSALSDPADKIKGLDLGAVDYITKPFDRGEVLARVRSQLKISRLTADLLSANRDLRQKQERIDEDLHAAAAIQRSLMPSVPLRADSVQMAWRFMPCERIGGDLLNFHFLADRYLVLHVIDVSGHGVPAAMMTVSVSQALSLEAGHIVKWTDDAPALPVVTPPVEVLRLLDREYPIERFGKYFTIAYLVLDCYTGELQYSRAGHPMPVVVRTDGTYELLGEGGTIIGLGEVLPFEDGRTVLSPGDRLIVYTDGIVELESADGEMYGEERFYRQIQAYRSESVEAVCDGLIDSLMGFGKGRSPQDDVTLLAVAFRGAATEASHMPYTAPRDSGGPAVFHEM